MSDNENKDETQTTSAKEAFWKALEANLGPRRGQPATGPKLTFAKRCAIFAAGKESMGPRRDRREGLELKIPKGLLAKAFGVSATTAGQIIECEMNGFYPAVAREWRRLGEEAFLQKYFTAETRERVLEASASRNDPNPNAKSHSLEKYGPLPFWSGAFNEQHYVGVIWRDGAWRVAIVEDGAATDAELPDSYPTSRKAFDAVKKLIDAGKLDG